MRLLTVAKILFGITLILLSLRLFPQVVTELLDDVTIIFSAVTLVVCYIGRTTGRFAWDAFTSQFRLPTDQERMHYDIKHTCPCCNGDMYIQREWQLAHYNDLGEPQIETLQIRCYQSVIDNFEHERCPVRSISRDVRVYAH